MSKIIAIAIVYDVNEPDKTIITTNAKREAVASVLETWIAGQIGKGKDERKANEKEKYTIKIQLDLSYDYFSVSSDTGNEGLTCGIIMSILPRLDNIQILPMTEPLAKTKKS